MPLGNSIQQIQLLPYLDAVIFWSRDDDIMVTRSISDMQTSDGACMSLKFTKCAVPISKNSSNYQMKFITDLLAPWCNVCSNY